MGPINRYCLVAILLAWVSMGANTFLLAQPAATDADQEVLTRGPVHEAFAEAVTYDPEPGVVATKAPPDPIEEIPPEQRPEGTNVAWIPGYWAWDDDRDDFLWISGVWRSLPPGRQWVPGYWGKSDDGYQWTSGYWADAQENDVEYLPEPPDSVEAGPNVPSPSPDQIWLPGSWVWHDARYAWRPGYWSPVQPSWVWVPAHYIWTPRGFIFVHGYWDYVIDRRGVLFAPVYFSGRVFARPGFFYSPSIVIAPGVFVDHLFLRPRYCHYYFGDYYAASYRGAGFVPWFAINTGRLGYDPIFAHNCWLHRSDADWAHGQQIAFEHRRDHEDARPPHTWAIQKTLDIHKMPEGAKHIPLALSLDDLNKAKDNSLKLKTIDMAERKQLSQHGLDVQKFREERQKLEIKSLTLPGQTQTTTLKTTKATLPKTTIVAKPFAELNKDFTPPKTFQGPKLDLNVEPKPRIKKTIDTTLQHNLGGQKLDASGTKLQQLPKIERKTFDAGADSKNKGTGGLKLDQQRKRDKDKDKK